MLTPTQSDFGPSLMKQANTKLLETSSQEQLNHIFLKEITTPGDGLTEQITDTMYSMTMQTI